MEQVQAPVTPPSATSSPASPGLFGTGIPTSAAFLVGCLLFLMPFADIKCNGLSLKQVSGINLATGFEVKDPSGNSLADDTEKNSAQNKKDPNKYAMIALGVGLLGFALSLMKFKGRSGALAFIGVVAAAALIGLFIDVRNQLKVNLPKDGTTSDNFNLQLSNGLGISVEFTPWFWIAVIAFLSAAYLGWRRKLSPV